MDSLPPDNPAIIIQADQEQTKLCPICHKKMIKRYENYVLTSYPPQYPWYWWCGGDNHREQGGIERGMTEDESAKIEWERKNK